MSQRQYEVQLTNGETFSPDLCNIGDTGWLYCFWANEDTGGYQHYYPPHAVEFYASYSPEDSQ